MSETWKRETSPSCSTQVLTWMSYICESKSQSLYEIEAYKEQLHISHNYKIWWVLLKMLRKWHLHVQMSVENNLGIYVLQSHVFKIKQKLLCHIVSWFFYRRKLISLVNCMHAKNATFHSYGMWYNGSLLDICYFVY